MVQPAVKSKSARAKVESAHGGAGTLGAKRNRLAAEATGDVLAHFDDDDLYAPEYIATMVGAMEREGADFVKLSAWLVHGRERAPYAQ